MTIPNKTGLFLAFCVVLTGTLTAQQLRRTSPASGAENVEPNLLGPAIHGTGNLDSLRNQLQQQQMKALIEQAKEQQKAASDGQNSQINQENGKKKADSSTEGLEASPEVQTAVLKKQTETFLKELPTSPLTPALKALAYYAINQHEKAMPNAITWAKQSPSVLGQTLLWELSKHFELTDKREALADGLARQWALTGRKLKLKRATLVSRIQGFGLYDPIGGPLRANQQIMAYCELHNFDLRLKGDAYQVTLNIGAEIKTSDGLRLWHNPSTWRGTLSYRSPIRDLFLNTRLTIPDNVHSGNDYIVTLTVKDETKQESVSTEIEFSVK